MVQYKLYYFDHPGIAEPIRMLLNYTNQPFEDVRLSSEQWKDEKPKFFYGTVPVLEVDGKQLAQSTTILRYFAEKFGLTGKDEWEKAKANELADFHKDVYYELSKYVYVKFGIREGNAEELFKEVFEPGVKRFFPLYMKALAQSGSDFLLPSGPTFVDFMVADYLNAMNKKLVPDALKPYPELVAYVDKVHSLPQLKKYLANRKYYD